MLPLEKTFAGVICPSPAPVQTSFFRWVSEPQRGLWWLTVPSSADSQAGTFLVRLVIFAFHSRNAGSSCITEIDWQPLNLVCPTMSGSVTVRPHTLCTSGFSERTGLVGCSSIVSSSSMMMWHHHHPTTSSSAIGPLKSTLAHFIPLMSKEPLVLVNFRAGWRVIQALISCTPFCSTNTFLD